MQSKSRVLVDFLQDLEGFGFVCRDEKVFHLPTNALISSYMDCVDYETEKELLDDEEALEDSEVLTIETPEKILRVNYRQVVNFYLSSYASIKAIMEGTTAHAEFVEIRNCLENKFHANGYAPAKTR